MTGGTIRSMLGEEGGPSVTVDRSDAGNALNVATTEALPAGQMAGLADWRAVLSQTSATPLSTVKRFRNAAPDLGFAMLREYAAASISGAVSERFIPQNTPVNP